MDDDVPVTTEESELVSQTDQSSPIAREITPSDLAHQLEPFIAHAAAWRADGKVLAALAAQTRVSDEVLLRVEEISGEIQTEIGRLSEMVRSIPAQSPTDLALITEVSDALRLVLLEITETGTKLYSSRSQQP